MSGQDDHVHVHEDTNPLGTDRELNGTGQADVLFGGQTHDTVKGHAGADILYGDGKNLLEGHGDFDSYPDTDGLNGFTSLLPSKFGGWEAPNGYSLLDEADFDMPDTGRGQVLELATNQNVSYSRVIDDVENGELMRLSFDIALPEHNRVAGSDGVRVVWNGEIVLEFSPGQKLVWETVSTNLAGGSGDGSNTLVLEGIGTSDWWGAVIDNVQLVTADDVNGGRDYLYGGAGDDELYGGNENDFLDGGAGKDKMDGGDGIDTVTYRDAGGAVSVNLGKGAGYRGDSRGDTYENIENAHGSDFNDTLKGDGGDNRLVGRNGNDNLQGGGGNDTLVGGRGADKLNGGSGSRDVAEYDWSTSGVDVNLTTGKGHGGFAEGDTLKKIEYVYGSHFDDVITGDANVNRLVGDYGDDSLNGMGGNDVLVGGEGADMLDGGAGDRDAADYKNAGEGVGVDLVKGGFAGEADGDKFVSVEFVYGSVHDDMITGNDAVNRLVGNDGNDQLFGGDGNDYLLGGLGDDELSGDAGDDVFLFDAVFGNDVILDFEAGMGRTDRIWLDDMGFANFEELDLRQTDLGVEVNVDTFGSLLLAGLEVDQLVADDFIF